MKRVLLIGFGVEGQAAARYFLARGDTVLAADKSADAQPVPKDFRDREGFHWISEETALIRMNEADLVLRSPGIPPSHPLMVQAAALGQKVTTPTGYWLAHHAPPGTLTVTGSKGKSTTVMLIVGLLTAMGESAAPFGNIGVPPLDESPVTVAHPILELSSYMLHDAPDGTYTHLVTNLFRDHTPWHGDEAAYHKAKLRPFRFDPPRPGLAPGDVITRYDLPNSITPIEKLTRIDQGNLSFSSNKLSADELPSSFRDGPNKLALQTSIAAVIKITGKAPSSEHIRQAAEGFNGLPSRQETVPSTDGRVWVNDALATIPEATIHALSGYLNQTVTLLLGGADREQDFLALAAILDQQKNVHPIIFGSTAGRLGKIFQKAGTGFTTSASFEDALSIAARETAKDGIILFSPAAASEPPHENFSVRAQIFRQVASKS